MIESKISTIETKCRELIRGFESKKGAKLFIVKICNYEVLSMLLNSSELESLMSEVDALLLSQIQTLGYQETTDIVREGCYISFAISPSKTFQLDEFTYFIYKALQTYLSEVHRDIILQCRLSSSDIVDDEHLVTNLLHGLINSEVPGYYVAFDPEARLKIREDYSKLREFQTAINNKHLSFAYQPIIERATGFIPYYECLLRITNHNAEVLSVGPFMPIAEKSGLNNVIDQTVLKMAVSELHAAHNISLSVNISNSGIADPNLLRIARELLSDRSVAKRLIIEITETSMNMDFEYTKYFTETLRSMGCKIALDDFGTGFTSFKQLQSLPIDVIKIDGSFIRDIADNQRNQHLVLALIDIAEHLGAKTVAEFVETGEIAKFLLDAKIDYMQGNFFSPALNYRSWDAN
ncbi:MAG: EAL domain-containing protein [Pseudomonadota bacterium]